MQFRFFLVLSVLISAGCASAPERLAFNRFGDAPVFVWSRPSDPYLASLRDSLKLDALVAEGDTDYQKVQKITAWVYGLWAHNGSNTPSKNDPLTIVSEARKGSRFRCVEYSIVLAGALNAVGIKARRLGLKTRDVETRRSGAGHVVTEAYLADEGRWIMADGQFGLIPTLQGRPINAVELQAALAEGAAGLDVHAGSGAQGWFGFVGPYLHYFDVRYDNRFSSPMPVGRKLMLVPLGEKEPRIFQRNDPIDDADYTRSLAEFYPKPS